MSSRMSDWPPVEEISPEQKLVLVVKGQGNFITTVGEMEDYLVERLEARLKLSAEMSAWHQHEVSDSHLKPGERITLATVKRVEEMLRPLRNALMTVQSKFREMERGQ